MNRLVLSLLGIGLAAILLVLMFKAWLSDPEEDFKIEFEQSNIKEASYPIYEDGKG